MGNTVPITVDGEPIGAFAPLRDGSLIQVADELVFRFDMPKMTHTAWSALSGEQHRALVDLAGLLSPPAEHRFVADRWWPLTPTAEQSVMLDWLLERGLTSDDAEVELAHFAAWNDDRRSLRG